jgi:dihydrofolate reductase
VSLDAYIEDAQGGFAWTEPSDEYFAFVTDLVRPIGTWLYGRRLYEAMAVWETDPALAAQSQLQAAFADVWRAGERIVCSPTLETVGTASTRLERRFDPDAVRAMKTSAAADLTVGGAALAAQAFDAGLVDAVPRSALEAIGRQQAATATAGRVDRMHGGVGRLGHKATQPSRRHQIAEALHAELGVTSSLRPSENCTAAQGECRQQQGRSPKLPAAGRMVGWMFHVSLPSG